MNLVTDVLWVWMTRKISLRILWRSLDGECRYTISATLPFRDFQVSYRENLRDISSLKLMKAMHFLNSENYTEWKDQNDTILLCFNSA